jgi:hypothetical protein
MFQFSLLLVLVAGFAMAQVRPVETLPIRRTVSGNTVRSSQDPEVKLTIEPAFRYVGADRFTLYDVADAEVHVFVEADAKKNVKRFYWVQFEEYLPNNQHKYDYADNPVIEAAGWKWHVAARLRPADEEVRPTSDTEHMLGVLKANGYKLQGMYAAIRLVHLTDASMRKELMIIYMERANTLDETAVRQHALRGMTVEH